MLHCTACGHDSADDARFCGQCGTPLARACGGCGAPLSAGQRFCTQCGRPAAGPAPAAAVPAVVALAEAEGLPAHARSAAIRLNRR